MTPFAGGGGTWRDITGQGRPWAQVLLPKGPPHNNHIEQKNLQRLTELFASEKQNAWHGRWVQAGLNAWTHWLNSVCSKYVHEKSVTRADVWRPSARRLEPLFLFKDHQTKHSAFVIDFANWKDMFSSFSSRGRFMQILQNCDFAPEIVWFWWWCVHCLLRYQTRAVQASGFCKWLDHQSSQAEELETWSSFCLA